MPSLLRSRSATGPQRGTKRHQIEAPSFVPSSLRPLNPEERPTPKKKIRLDPDEVQSPGSADGSFNANGSVIVSGKHAIKKVLGFFTTWWRTPRKSYSPTMAAAKSVRDEEVQCLDEQDVIDLTSDEDEVAVVSASMKTQTEENPPPPSSPSARRFRITDAAKRESTRRKIQPGKIMERLRAQNPNTTNFARNFSNPSDGGLNVFNGRNFPPFTMGKSRPCSPRGHLPRRQLMRLKFAGGVDAHISREENEKYRQLVADNTAWVQQHYRSGDGTVALGSGSKPTGWSPFFSRPAVVPAFGFGGAITRGQITPEEARADESRILQKEARKGEPRRLVVDLVAQEDKGKDEPVIEKEVVTVRDDDETPVSAVQAAAARHRSSADDDGEIEAVLEIYSPRRATSASPSGKRRSSPRKSRPLRKQSTLESEFRMKEVYQSDFLAELKDKYEVSRKERDLRISAERVRRDHAGELSRRMEDNIEKRLREHLQITEVAVVEDYADEDGEDEAELPDITPEMEDDINAALGSPSSVTLVSAFRMDITRKDIDTLKGLNWLNDEIINFYMQMIVERSKETDNWPNVYAFNTFFYPKIMQQGHAAVKRWTRKVDVFSYDLLLVPVHLGMHWCLAVVDFSVPGVYYYDSMGGNNRACLEALCEYLRKEHLDKKQEEYSTDGFQMVVMKDIPQQNNSSDCGMFSCKFAEYLSRRADITFDQADMPYFRRRMMWEIVKNNILHP